MNTEIVDLAMDAVQNNEQTPKLRSRFTIEEKETLIELIVKILHSLNR